MLESSSLLKVIQTLYEFIIIQPNRYSAQKMQNSHKVKIYYVAPLRGAMRLDYTLPYKFV